MDTKKVWVISWHKPDSFGGFDWYPIEADARAAFAREAFGDTWKGEPNVRVRLVAADVPTELEGQALTDWLDEDIDALEVTLPAIDEGMTR